MLYSVTKIVCNKKSAWWKTLSNEKFYHFPKLCNINFFSDESVQADSKSTENTIFGEVFLASFAKKLPEPGIPQEISYKHFGLNTA